MRIHPWKYLIVLLIRCCYVIHHVRNLFAIGNKCFICLFLMIYLHYKYLGMTQSTRSMTGENKMWRDLNGLVVRYLDQFALLEMIIDISCYLNESVNVFRTNRKVAHVNKPTHVQRWSLTLVSYLSQLTLTLVRGCFYI